MGKIYRYRSVEAAVSKYAEISRQEINLASPHELNDPNESRLNMYWQADKVAWDGFVDHFLQASVITQSSTTLEQESVGGIVIPGHHQLTNQAKGFARDIGDIPEIREAVSDTSAKLYDNEFDAGRIAGALEPLNEIVHQALTRYKFNGSALIPLAYETRNGRPVPTFRIPPPPPEWALNIPRPTHKKVPGLYVAKMAEMSTRPWYAACFSKSYANQAMWQHYGQAGHGVCLEFDAERLQLERVEVHEVNYEPTLPRMDFFPYLTRITELEAMSIYKNRNRTSSLTPDFASEEHRLKWHAEVVERTKRIALTKTSDWGPEEEIRLLRIDLLDAGSGTVAFPSEALTGIIFGEKATDETKDAIRSIMISKHRHSPLSNFLFYDAVTLSNGKVHRQPSEEQLYDM